VVLLWVMFLLMMLVFRLGRYSEVMVLMSCSIMMVSSRCVYGCRWVWSSWMSM